MGIEFGRDPERTPMQWSCGPHAGFCGNCTPWLPVASDYCTSGDNVEAELASNTSMLAVMKATVAARRRSSSLLEGAQHIFLADDAQGLLAYRRAAAGAATAVVVLNWGAEYSLANLTLGFSGTGYAHLSTADGAYSTARLLNMHAVPLRPGEGLLLFSQPV